MNRQVGGKLMPHSHRWLLVLLVAMFLGVGLSLATQATVFAQDGYDYTVQEGESWDTVAAQTGVSVDELQAANPEAAERENGWLLVGETLLIPTAAVATPTRNHKVQSGESWNSIADDYGISVGLLRAANPQAVRSSNILYRGEELVIPTPGTAIASPTAAPTPDATATVTEDDGTPDVTEEAEAEETGTPTATPSPEATEEATTEAMTETVTAEVTVEATEEATEEATVEATDAMSVTDVMTGTEAMTDTEVMTDTVEVDASETVTTTDDAAAGDDVAESAFDLPTCPERFADYPQVMTELSNSLDDDGLAAVVAFLAACDALVEDDVIVSDLNDDGSDDLVVVYQNPSEEQIFVEGDLVIFNSTDAGYVLGYRARAAGEVRLLTVDDINLDELIDVAWVDTTCGASTCFDTVNVRSWDGTSWADWTDGTITMAYAEIGLTDVSEEGLGKEITMEGGIYGSVGAGPQRSRAEVWSSVEGAPYALAEKSYSATECLYHTVMDANRAFLDAPTDGFEAAIALYTQAAEDDGLIKCWVRNDELAELRSFSLFRLAVIAGYSDDSATAAAQIADLTEQYPGSIYDDVGQVWLTSYDASGDAALACEEVAVYAEEDSAAWEMLADYGYTNPSFEAIDVCPILDLSVAEEEDAEEATE